MSNVSFVSIVLNIEHPFKWKIFSWLFFLFPSLQYSMRVLEYDKIIASNDNKNVCRENSHHFTSEQMGMDGWHVSWLGQNIIYRKCCFACVCVCVHVQLFFFSVLFKKIASFHFHFTIPISYSVYREKLSQIKKEEKCSALGMLLQTRCKFKRAMMSQRHSICRRMSYIRCLNFWVEISFSLPLFTLCLILAIFTRYDSYCVILIDIDFIRRYVDVSKWMCAELNWNIHTLNMS